MTGFSLWGKKGGRGGGAEGGEKQQLNNPQAVSFAQCPQSAGISKGETGLHSFWVPSARNRACHIENINGS